MCVFRAAILVLNNFLVHNHKLMEPDDTFAPLLVPRHTPIDFRFPLANYVPETIWSDHLPFYATLSFLTIRDLGQTGSRSSLPSAICSFSFKHSEAVQMTPDKNKGLMGCSRWLRLIGLLKRFRPRFRAHLHSASLVKFN